MMLTMGHVHWFDVVGLLLIGGVIGGCLGYVLRVCQEVNERS